MRIAIGCDHAGHEYKQRIMRLLDSKDIVYIDYGTHTSESCDYPVYAKAVAHSVTEGEADFGILICGTGIGMAMAANKVRGVRAAPCTETFGAKYTRLHNNANILCIGARIIGLGVALEIVDVFINTPFEGGKHKRRVDMFEEN